MKSKLKIAMLIAIIMLLLVGVTTISLGVEKMKIDEINAVVTNASVEATWSVANGADGYDVYVDIPSIGYQYIGSTESNKVYIVGAKENETYGLKVKAYKVNNNRKTYSEFSPEIKFKIGENAKVDSKLNGTVKLKAESYGNTGSLEWNKVNGASGYEIYASLDERNFVKIGSTSDTKATLIGIHKDKTYILKIRPFLEKNGEIIYGTYSNSIVLKFEENIETNTKLNKVTNVKSVIDGNKAKLTWDKQDGADGYEISINMPGFGDATYSANEAEITLQGFTPNYTYKVKIRAYKYVNGQKQYGDYSNLVYIKFKEEIKIDRVSSLKVTMNGSRATLDWNKVSGVDGYEILVTVPGNKDITTTTTSTSKTITGVTEKNSNYTAKVRAYKKVNGKTVYGEYSNKVYFKNEEEVKLDRVTGVEVTVDGERAIVKWDKVKGADGYEIGLETPSGAYDKYSTTGTSKTIYGITDTDDEYAVKVKAYKKVNGEKTYGEYSRREYFKASEEELDRVTGVEVTVDGERAIVKWDKVKGADGYEIGLETPSGAYDKYSTTGTSKTIYGITDTDDEYAVKVKAYKKVNGEKTYGEYSRKEYFRAEEELDRVTDLEAIRNQTIVVFRWDEVKDADGYEIVLNIPGIGDCTYTEETTMRYMTGFTETRYKYTVKVRAFKYIRGEKVYGDYSRIVSF